MKKQRILILGLGQYPQGSGVSAALYFARKGNDVLVSDFYYTDAMEKNVQTLKKFPNVRFIFKKHPLKELRAIDLVVRHQRARNDEPELVRARELGIPIETAESIFMKRCPCPIVGVTGTRGKSTTTTLVYEILKRSHPKKKVWLGGNISNSPLSFLHRVRKTDLVVLELSSFQLEGTGAAGISPQFALITNLMRDHLNAYENMEEYAEAKAQIFRHQKPEDVVVLNEDDAYGRRWAKEAPGQVILFGSKSKFPVPKSDVKLLGSHNELNIIAASRLACAVGATQKGIRDAIKNFRGLPDRLETISTVRGVRFVNDTTATTPDAAIMAITSLAPVAKRIHLLAGGADKELEFDEIAKVMKRHRVSVSLFEGTAFAKFSKALDRAGVSYTKVGSMKEAAAFHLANAKKGDAIVLSPGCASFGMFKNEFDRGEQFKKEVGKLGK